MKSNATIRRDTLTWVLYFMHGTFSFLLNGMGPVIPFLRAEFKMSYTVSSLHFSAFAAGMLVAGILTNRLTDRFGRRKVFWWAAFGMAGSLVVFLAGSHPVVTIGGALLVSSTGAFLSVISPATLAERYGDLRAVALSEGSMINSICGGLAPVLVGFFVKMGWGWRSALLTVIAVIVLFKLFFGRVTFPEAASAKSRRVQAKLPLAYWAWWTIILLGVAVEFCIIFWSATFFEVERGVARTTAAFAISIFLGAMVAGRFAGSVLSRKINSISMIISSSALCLAGFLLHWLASPVWLAMLGLFLAGLGVANFYPQIFSLAVGTAMAQTDLASARMSVSSGLAVLSLPLLLGALADRIGLASAYGVVVILLVLIGVGTLVIHYSSFTTQKRRT